MCVEVMHMCVRGEECVHPALVALGERESREREGAGVDIAYTCIHQVYTLALLCALCLL